MLPGALNSAGVIGWLVPWTSSRRPGLHTVCRRLVPGCGPRSRSSTTGAASSGSVPSIRVRRTSGRLTNWLFAVPSLKYCLERLPVLRRRSAVRAAPRPPRRSASGAGPRSARPGRGPGSARDSESAQRQVGPQGLVDRVHPEADVGGDEAAAGDEREREAGRDHPLGPLGRARSPSGRPAGGRRCAPRRPSSSATAAAASRVLGHRRRPEQARRGRGSADHPVRRSRARRCPSVSSMSLMTTSAPSPSAPSVWITPLRGNPQRDDHQEAQAAEEDHQALGDRPGPAEREAARVGLDPGLRDVGDDVALGLRGQRAVGEHRHGLGPGQHRRVDLRRGGLGQRRRVLAVGQRAARPGEAVALRAVGAEQLRAERGVRSLGGSPARRSGSRGRRPGRRRSRRSRRSAARLNVTGLRSFSAPTSLAGMRPVDIWK